MALKHYDINRYRYPLDTSGKHPANHISDEIHLISHDPSTRTLSLEAGAFYTDSVKIYHVESQQPDQPIQYLHPSQYGFKYMVETAVKLTGLSVASVLTITDTSLTGTLRISYQCVGREYEEVKDHLVGMLETINLNKKPVYYENLIGRPEKLMVPRHLHHYKDIHGAGPFFHAITALMNSLQRRALVVDKKYAVKLSNIELKLARIAEISIDDYNTLTSTVESLKSASTEKYAELDSDINELRMDLQNEVNRITGEYTGKFTEHKQLLDTHAQSIADHQSRLGTLDNRVTTIESFVNNPPTHAVVYAANEAAVTEANRYRITDNGWGGMTLTIKPSSDVADIKSTLDDHQGSIENLTLNTTSLGNLIDTANRKINENLTKITALERWRDDTIAPFLSGYEETIRDINERHNTLATEVSTKDGEHDGRLTTLEQNATVLSTKVDEHIQTATSQHTTLEERVTTLERTSNETDTDLQGKITALERATTEALNGTKSELENNISTVNTTLGSRIDTEVENRSQAETRLSEAILSTANVLRGEFQRQDENLGDTITSEMQRQDGKLAEAKTFFSRGANLIDDPTLVYTDHWKACKITFGDHGLEYTNDDLTSDRLRPFSTYSRNACQTFEQKENDDTLVYLPYLYGTRMYLHFEFFVISDTDISDSAYVRILKKEHRSDGLTQLHTPADNQYRRYSVRRETWGGVDGWRVIRKEIVESTTGRFQLSFGFNLNNQYSYKVTDIKIIDVSELKSLDDILSNRISENRNYTSEQIDRLSTRMGDDKRELSKKITSLEGDRTTHASKLDRAEQNITNILQKNTEQDTEIRNLRDQISGNNNTANRDITSVRDRVSANETAIQGLQSSSENLEEKIEEVKRNASDQKTYGRNLFIDPFFQDVSNWHAYMDENLNDIDQTEDANIRTKFNSGRIDNIASVWYSYTKPIYARAGRTLTFSCTVDGIDYGHLSTEGAEPIVLKVVVGRAGGSSVKIFDIKQYAIASATNYNHDSIGQQGVVLSMQGDTIHVSVHLDGPYAPRNTGYHHFGFKLETNVANVTVSGIEICENDDIVFLDRKLMQISSSMGSLGNVTSDIENINYRLDTLDNKLYPFTRGANMVDDPMFANMRSWSVLNNETMESTGSHPLDTANNVPEYDVRSRYFKRYPGSESLDHIQFYQQQNGNDYLQYNDYIYTLSNKYAVKFYVLMQGNDTQESVVPDRVEFRNDYFGGVGHGPSVSVEKSLIHTRTIADGRNRFVECRFDVAIPTSTARCTFTFRFIKDGALYDRLVTGIVITEVSDIVDRIVMNNITINDKIDEVKRQVTGLSSGSDGKINEVKQSIQTLETSVSGARELATQGKTIANQAAQTAQSALDKANKNLEDLKLEKTEDYREIDYIPIQYDRHDVGGTQFFIGGNKLSLSGLQDGIHCFTLDLASFDLDGTRKVVKVGSVETDVFAQDFSRQNEMALQSFFVDNPAYMKSRILMINCNSPRSIPLLTTSQDETAYIRRLALYRSLDRILSTKLGTNTQEEKIVNILRGFIKAISLDTQCVLFLTFSHTDGMPVNAVVHYGTNNYTHWIIHRTAISARNHNRDTSQRLEHLQFAEDLTQTLQYNTMLSNFLYDSRIMDNHLNELTNDNLTVENGQIEGWTILDKSKAKLSERSITSLFQRTSENELIGLSNLNETYWIHTGTPIIPMVNNQGRRLELTLTSNNPYVELEVKLVKITENARGPYVVTDGTAAFARLRPYRSSVGSGALASVKSGSYRLKYQLDIENIDMSSGVSWYLCIRPKTGTTQSEYKIGHFCFTELRGTFRHNPAKQTLSRTKMLELLGDDIKSYVRRYIAEQSNPATNPTSTWDLSEFREQPGTEDWSNIREENGRLIAEGVILHNHTGSVDNVVFAPSQTYTVRSTQRWAVPRDLAGRKALITVRASSLAQGSQTINSAVRQMFIVLPQGSVDITVGPLTSFGQFLSVSNNTEYEDAIYPRSLALSAQAGSVTIVV